MAKNHMADVAKMLGLELGEEFKINLCPNELFKFDMNGILAQEQGEASWRSANHGMLQELVYGSFEIVKLPWKPKKGDVYFTFVLMGDKWGVGSLHWGGFPNEYGSLEKGWVYRTCAEAQAALPAVAKEIGAEYELPTSYTETVEQWKPKVGETYYSFCRFLGEWCAWQQQWSNHPFDLALLAKGWVYRTQEEAEAALPKVAAEFGVEYAL